MDQREKNGQTTSQAADADRRRPEGQDVSNGHQKAVSGKKQHGPDSKLGKSAGGNDGSKGQNLRDETDETGKGGQSVGSHKPGGDGPGTKKFKHDHDPAQPKDRSERG